MNAAEILKTKGTKVVTISPDRQVREAIQTLVENGVGALVVVDEQQVPVGMITERDVLRASDRCFDCLKELKVSDLMSREVIIGLPDQSADALLGMMTDKFIRHLPIMDQGKLSGLLSIGDLVKAKVQWAEVEIYYLKDYISDRYPG